MSRAAAAILRDTPGIVVDPLENTIDPEAFTPRLLALVSNALVWRESSELRQAFNLGTNDWRVLTALAIKPGMAATDISDFLGLNKAVISKSVSTLVGRGLVVLSDGPRGSRPIYLTESGAVMHDNMLPISMRGQEIILDGMSAEEVDALNKVLHRMLRQVRAYLPPDDDIVTD